MPLDRTVFDAFVNDSGSGTDGSGWDKEAIEDAILDPVDAALAPLEDRSDYDTVTQATSITTGVTLNTLAGAITTVSQTLAAGAEASFVVTNSQVRATDVVSACLKSTTSAGGPFLVGVTATANGSFTITVTNLHASAAGDNTLVISFFILRTAP